MIAIIKADGTAERRQLEAMRERAAARNADIEQAVRAVMENVREGGLEAVRRYSREFDRREPYEIPRETLEQAATQGDTQAAMLTVDGSDLKQFDSSALAVLVGLHRRAAATGRTLRIEALPDRLGELARVYGVTELVLQGRQGDA